MGEEFTGGIEEKASIFERKGVRHTLYALGIATILGLGQHQRSDVSNGYEDQRETLENGGIIECHKLTHYTIQLVNEEIKLVLQENSDEIGELISPRYCNIEEEVE